jgi:hypothetical protein
LILLNSKKLRCIENPVVVAADGQENDIDDVDDVDSDGNGVDNQ